MSANTGLLAPCGGCGDDAGPIHRCPSCFVHMHPFCGTAVGAEGFGQFIMYPACQTKEQEPPSASPIVAALSLQKERGKVADKGGATECPQHHSIDLASFNEETKSEDGDEPPLAHNDTEVSEVPETESGRSTQHVSTIQQRRRVIAWLESCMRKKGKKNMFARVVDEIPDVFISATRNANLNKAINWWKKRETFCERGAVSISTRRDTGRKRVNTKAVKGRGRRRSAWVDWIYPRLCSELDRLRKIGLKFDSGLLRQLALRMLRRPDAPKADANGVLLEKKINTRWVQSFMETHNIILRAQSGKRQLSPEKTAEIEKSVAVHLGELKRGFESGKYDENVIENIDETHFVIDFDNGKTLGFGGESQVKNRLMSDLERKMYPTLYLHPRSHASKYHKFFATLACMDKENYNVQARLFITHRGGPSQ